MALTPKQLFLGDYSRGLVIQNPQVLVGGSCTPQNTQTNLRPGPSGQGSQSLPTPPEGSFAS